MCLDFCFNLALLSCPHHGGRIYWWWWCEIVFVVVGGGGGGLFLINTKVFTRSWTWSNEASL
jgi:hypothetical protein